MVKMQQDKIENNNGYQQVNNGMNCSNKQIK
jgi:hypothetical protein